MRQYYSNNKNYNAILESMAQIRQNQLNEAYGSMPHRGGGMSGAMDRMAQGQIPLNAEAMYGDEEEMEEGMHGDEEEMEERYMYEGEHEDDEDAQMEALAEMMDEALMELDDDDDNDNQMLGEEEDDERRARRRARLRNALLIGAGLVATGGLAGAAMMNPTARGMIAKGAGEAFTGIKDMAGGVAQAGYGMLPQTTRDQIAGGIEAGQEYVSGVAGDVDDRVMSSLQKDNFNIPGLGPDDTERARRAAGRVYMGATGKIPKYAQAQNDLNKARKLSYERAALSGRLNPAISQNFGQ